MATPNYDINYDDKRLTSVEADKKAALNEVDVTYGNMISNSDKYYQEQINASKEWADKQSQLQQEQTDFAIEQIEQQKEQAQKDYTKEQSGAYVDWQKQSNQYGANAEQIAAQGMAGSGFSESSQVSMYNTYQNRYVAAREAYTKAVLNYDNAIKDARLQNNSALAEIAYQALQKQLELSLQGFQYKNELLIQKSNKKLEVDKVYHSYYQDVLDQINKENALAEEVRQFGLSQELEKEKMAQQKAIADAQLAEEQRQFNQKMAEEQRQFNRTHSGSIDKGGGGGDSGGGGGGSDGKKTISGKVKEVVTNIEEKVKSKEPEIDMGSVLALGYGPISASRLNELVSQGLAEKYVSGGKTKFRKTAYANKQASLFPLLK